MSMYFVGIDISKYKHDCCIISAANQNVVSKFTFPNDKAGFEELLTVLNSLSSPYQGIQKFYDLKANQNRLC